MVLFCWFEEKVDVSFTNCRTWFPIVVVEASNEREAWEELYKFDSIIWWDLQGQTNYRETKQTTNLAKELYDNLKMQRQYKTRQAKEPTIHGHIVTKKTNY